MDEISHTFEVIVDGRLWQTRRIIVKLAVMPTMLGAFELDASDGTVGALAVVFTSL